PYNPPNAKPDPYTTLFRSTISGVNDAPLAVNDSYTTAEDTALNVAAPGVLANDSDVDGDTLSAVLVSQPTHGSLTLNSNGSFSCLEAATYELKARAYFVSN